MSFAGSLATSYTYNTLGNLVQTEQGSQIRRFDYDSLGRLTRQKLAEQKATLDNAGDYVGAGGAGARWSNAFWYDERSNLVRSEALACLEKRGLHSSELVEQFQLGYSNRTLAYRLPDKNSSTGAETRARLQRLGVLRTQRTRTL